MPPAAEKPSPKTEDRNSKAEPEDKTSEDKNQGVTLSRTVTRVSQYSGPIPPAEEFARYEKTYPGSADRLFTMAEREQEDTVSVRKWSLLAATVFGLATLAAIAYILTANPNAFMLVALAAAHVLPSITDFMRGITDNALSKKERELEIQIRKDNHELDMIAARQRLELGSGSDESVTQRARRLESENESNDFQEGNR